MTCSVFFLRAKQSSVWPKCQGGSWNALGRRGGGGGGMTCSCPLFLSGPWAGLRFVALLLICFLRIVEFVYPYHLLVCHVRVCDPGLCCVCDFFRALINSLCCRKAASFLQDLRAASVGVTLLSRAGSGAQLQRGLVGGVSCQVYFWCAKIHY